MAKFIIILLCTMCGLIFRTMSAPIIKASGVQWSEPKGSGKGNITLIMIPQNTSTCNDTDMIVAVKSDYQILSQDTQLLNLVVNENKDDKQNNSNVDSLKNCSRIYGENNKNLEREQLMTHTNTAKYFEPEKKVPSNGGSNKTINIYPALVENYHNLIAMDGTLTTSFYSTINVIQLLSRTELTSETESPAIGKISENTNDVLQSNQPNTTNSLDYLGLNQQNSQNLTENKNNIPKLMDLDSDKQFLHEALNILEKLNQDPSYYAKYNSNEIPSTANIKDHGDMSLLDPKSKLLKLDDSVLPPEGGENQINREYEHINSEHLGAANVYGNKEEKIESSTCLPFFMSFSESSTAHLMDIDDPKEIHFEKESINPLSDKGSNETLFLKTDNISVAGIDPSTENNSFSSPSNDLNQISTAIAVTNNVVNDEARSNESSQTVPVANYSVDLKTETPQLSPVFITTNKIGLGIDSGGSPQMGVAVSCTESSLNQPNYLFQTVPAANQAVGMTDLSPDSSQRFQNNISGLVDLATKPNTGCATTTNVIGLNNISLIPSKLQEAVGPSSESASELNSITVLENQFTTLKTSPTMNVELLSDGILNPKQQANNEIGIKSNENIVSSSLNVNNISQNVMASNAAIGSGSLSGGLSECVTVTHSFGVNQQQSDLAKAGVEAMPKKITLEPSIDCETLMKKGDFTTNIPEIQKQDACLKEKQLTLPLVESSIFLANNNEMPKGEAIPITLNASVDEFGLLDVQEKNDRMHEKVAQLYNHNPILFNVDNRQLINTSSKPLLKNNEPNMSPTFYLNKTPSLDNNTIFKLNFAGNKVILEKEPLTRSEINYEHFNSPLEDQNSGFRPKIGAFESETQQIQPEPRLIYTPQKPISHISNIRKHMNRKDVKTTVQTFIEPSDEEESLLTILNSIEKVTLKSIEDDASQYNSRSFMDDQGSRLNTTDLNSQNVLSESPRGTLLDKNSIASEKQGSNNVDSENVKTTNQIDISLKPYSKLANKNQVKIFKKDEKVKVGKEYHTGKKGSDENSPQKNYESLNVKDDIPFAQQNISIPADSVQKIVIEIVRNTIKPENGQMQYMSKNIYTKNELGKSIEDQKTQVPETKTNRLKSNFVPFQSAWKPVQAVKKQPFSISDSLGTNIVNRNKQMDDSKLHPGKVWNIEGDIEQHLIGHNPNSFVKKQGLFPQVQSPTLLRKFNSPLQQTTIGLSNGKSLGANILKLLKADKTLMKRK